MGRHIWQSHGASGYDRFSTSSTLTHAQPSRLYYSSELVRSNEKGNKHPFLPIIPSKRQVLSSFGCVLFSISLATGGCLAAQEDLRVPNLIDDHRIAAASAAAGGPVAQAGAWC